MAIDDPRPLTRKELAEFLPTQRAIRAFEKLFDLVPSDFEDNALLIEEASVTAQTGVSKAQLAIDMIHALSAMAEFITTAPAQEPENIGSGVNDLMLEPVEQNNNHLVGDYIDLDRNPAAINRESRLRWNAAESCLDIGMSDNVTLQAGLEQLVRVVNNTGAQINNGEVVRFSGVSGDIEVTKYIADGSAPAFYFIGIATDDIPNGDTGFVTKFGKVRDIDTSSWAVGTLLYASATTAGEMVSSRPTSPNDVIFIGVVLTQDATTGSIFVNPVIPVGLTYGAYTSTVDQTLSAANTAHSVNLENTEVQYGISVASNSRITVTQSGLYDVAVSLQLTSSNSSSLTAYAWLSKNGADVSRTRLDFTIKANGDTKVLSTTFKINLVANDYIEIKWAGDSTNLILDAIPATAFSPSCPSAIVAISQTQL